MAFRRAFYGIDLGSTYTVVTKAINENKSWKYTNLKLPNNPINGSGNIKETELLPSVVYFAKDGRVIVGEYAKQAIYFDPEHVYINAKIDLGGNLRQNEYNEISPQQACIEILKICFSRIVEDGGMNAQVRISVPASFSQDKRNDTINAAEQAIFELKYNKIKFIRITEEPFAAFINLVVNENQFINMIKSKKNTIMLIDIGGSTMDIVIGDITYQKGDNTLEVNSPYEPITFNEFAGVRFDYELMKKFMQDFLYYYELYEYEILEQDKIILQKRMLLIAENVKKFFCDRLNANRRYECICDFRGLRIDLSKKLPFQISISKKQMDIVLDRLLNNREENENNQSIRTIIQNTLSYNKLTSNDIDCIYLIGGMAYYNQIWSTIKSVIQKPIIIAKNPLHGIATGIALSTVIQTCEGTTEITKTLEQLKQPILEANYNLSKDNYNTNISEIKIIGMSYYLDVENSMPVEIISKNEIYPCAMKKANVQFKTSSQIRMKFILYKGNSIYDYNMQLLREKSVEFSEIVSIGTTIDIWYEIDLNMIITIYAYIDNKPLFIFSTNEN